MISVIVPVKDEPEAALAALKRLAAAADAELVLAEPAADPRGARLARAARRARGDVLFFVHADSRPPDDALALIQRTLEAGAAAGAFSLAYENAGPGMRWVAWWANLRARAFGLAFGDQGIFCRRETYDAAGGFRDLPVCDDLDLVRRLRRAGRFVIRPEATVTSARRYRERGILRQVLRVWRVVAGYFLGASPDRLARWYYG
jgi:glycosyltransferase involved in cell wall biosynthesis